MAEFDMSGLPDALVSVMKSPEIAEIMKSIMPQKGGSEIKTDEEENKKINAEPEKTVPPETEETVETAAETVTVSGAKPEIAIPNEVLSALPGVISALSSNNSSPFTLGKNGKNGDKQRKALLTALRPYLSSKRRRVVDGMIGLEGLSGMFGAFMGSGEEK